MYVCEIYFARVYCVIRMFGIIQLWQNLSTKIGIWQMRHGFSSQTWNKSPTDCIAFIRTRALKLYRSRWKGHVSPPWMMLISFIFYIRSYYTIECNHVNVINSNVDDLGLRIKNLKIVHNVRLSNSYTLNSHIFNCQYHRRK